MVIEGGHNHCYRLWDIIMSSYPNGKTGVQTNNYTTIASHASIYAATHKYKIQQNISMNIQRPACTQKSPTSYIQEF